MSALRAYELKPRSVGGRLAAGASVRARFADQRDTRAGRFTGAMGRPGMGLGSIVVISLVAISLIQLLISIMAGEATYKLSELKQAKVELGTTSQILIEQVDSLSSQQNLANSAQRLGMVANPNPVFLRLSDSSVLGTPRAVRADNAVIPTRNLIPNSALVLESNDIKRSYKKSLAQASSTKLDTASVNNAAATSQANAVNSASGQVAYSRTEIPASPTN